MNNSKNNYLIPIAIVVAGILVAGAVFMQKDKPDELVVDREQNKQENVQTPPNQESLEAMDPITQDDHLRGNLNAKITIVEYSDFECPFCKRFHDTMNQVMSTYGDSGDVAWVYRHWPIESLHPIKAKKEAIASECAAEQGGNDAFWSFADEFYEQTLSNNRTDLNTLPKIAEKIGLNVPEFEICLESGKYDSKIAKSIQDAMETGGGGTPWSILVTADGKKYPINGAQPYESVKQMIDQILAK